MKIIQKLCAIFYCFPIISRIFSRVFPYVYTLWNIILNEKYYILISDITSIIISFLARKKSQAVCLQLTFSCLSTFFVTDGTTIPFKESLNGVIPSRKCSNDLIPHSQHYSVPENISRVLQQIALSTST